MKTGNIVSRLATFSEYKLSNNTRYGASQLARLGFIYNSTIGKIVCSVCTFVFPDVTINLSSVSKEHRKFSSECPYCDSEKIPSADKTLECFKTLMIKEMSFDSSGSSESGKDMLQNESGQQLVRTSGNAAQRTSENVGKSTAKYANDGINKNKENYVNSDSKMNLNSDSCKFGIFNWSNVSVQLLLSMTTVLNIVKSVLERNETFENETVLNDETDSGRGATASALSGRSNITSVEIQQQAKHPGLSTREERRRTFRGQEQKYSHSIHHNIIDRLVEAGLYYVGPTDNVRCFFCDGGLKNFSRDDEPFTEHKKWFSQCKYVQYVEQTRRAEGLVRDSVDARIVPASQLSTGNVTSSTSLNRPLHDGDVDFQQPRKVLESREVKARLELPIYAKLQEMGYQKDHVRQAIEFRFATYGDDYTSVEEIIRDILRIQGEGALPLNKRSGAEAIHLATRTCQPTESTPSSTSRSQDNPDGCAPRISPSTCSASTAVPRSSSNVQRAVTVTASTVRRGAGNVEAAAAEIISDNDPNIQHLTKEIVVAALKDQTITDTELAGLFREFEQSTHIRTCQVCLENEITTVFLPCGHYVCCNTCTTRLTHCCICRSLIRGTVKALTSRDKS